MEALKAFHLIGVAYFLGFLLLDAIVLRRFLDSECRGKKILFYEKAKYSLYFFTAVIVLTGVLMFYPYKKESKTAFVAKAKELRAKYS